MADLKLLPGIDASDMIMDPKTNDFILDSGLSTAVYLSVFSSPYWGNSILSESERLTSNLSALWALPVTSSTRNQIERSVAKSLDWVVAFGVASEVIVEAVIVGSSRIDLRIEIVEPNQENNRLFGYQLNWESQRVTMRG